MSTSKRKVHANAFPEKVVVMAEVSLTRTQMKIMYIDFVDNLNDLLSEDGVTLSISEALSAVDEVKFASVLAQMFKVQTNYISAIDFINDVIGCDFTRYTIPEKFENDIRQSAVYEQLLSQFSDQETERAKDKVIADAKRLGLTVIR
jgi:hypothetical protein